MKIAVISDTHGCIDAYNKALEHFDGADLIVHAGDVLYQPPRLTLSEGYDIPALADAINGSAIPVVIAQGNCDPQVYEELLEVPVQAPYAVVQWENTRLLINHGHLINKDDMIQLGAKYRAQYVISGHTHIPVLERVGEVVLMNPGSPAIPKYEAAGRAVPTVGLIEDGGAKIIDVDNGAIVLQLNT